MVGYGTRKCIDRFPATDAVLDVEPTDMAIMPVEGGLEHLRIEIAGREAHAATRSAAIAAVAAPACYGWMGCLRPL